MMSFRRGASLFGINSSGLLSSDNVPGGGGGVFGAPPHRLTRSPCTGRVNQTHIRLHFVHLSTRLRERVIRNHTRDTHHCRSHHHQPQQSLALHLSLIQTRKIFQFLQSAEQVWNRVEMVRGDLKWKFHFHFALPLRFNKITLKK